MADDLKVIVDADASPLRRELGSAGGSVKIFGREVDSQSRSVRAFGAAVDKQKDSLRGLKSVAEAGAVGIAGAGALAVASLVKTGAAFESQMARVQAVTGATNSDMGELRRLAIKLGADTKFSAGEAAEGMYELASAGFDVKETQAALPGVLSLAAASSIGLAEAAEINSNALRGFGLASSESTHVADVLAQSVNSSSVEMQDLQLSLKYIGPVASATGESFESMIAAVSLMGDAGIKGEQAGTTLRSGLINLVKPTKQVEEGLGALNLEITDLQGPNGLLPLPQLVGKLQEGMQGLSKAQQAQALAQVFGKESLSGMLKVVEAGPAKLRKLSEEFEHSDGASKKAATTMNDTVKGAFEELQGSFETIEIEVFEKFAPGLHDALSEATRLVNSEGSQLQKALADAMGTPEFKQADFGRKAEILIEAIGKVWHDSGLGPDIREGLIDAFNFALPRVADAVGKSSVTVAETFVKGFLEASPLGKLAIATWLFTKFGGFAALRAAGTRAGTEVAIGMAAPITAGVSAGNSGSIAAGVATQIASAERAVKPVSEADRIAVAGGGRIKTKAASAVAEDVATVGATGLAAKATGILNKAMKAAGVVAGGYFAAEFGAKAVEGLTGKDLLENQSLAASLTHGFNTKGVLRVEVDAEQKGEGLNFHKSQAELDSLKAHFQQTMAKIRADAAVGLGGIRKALGTGLAQADETWLQGTTPWRQHVVEAMRAAVSEIKQGMHAGTVGAEEGQKAIDQLLGRIHLTTGSDPFGLAEATTKQFQEANAITSSGVADWTRQLAKMPKAAREKTREATAAMLTAWAQGHPKLEAQVANLTRYEIQKFGGANRQLEASTAAAMASISKSAAEGATGTGSALTNIFTNLSNALAAVGSSKIPTFSATVLSTASAYHHTREQTQKGFAVGGFVPGADRRDHVHAVLGSREAVLTVHDQPEVQAGLAVGKAMGITRAGSLGELFSGPRKPNYFALGGFAGGQTGTAATTGVLPHPGLVGPQPMQSLGQSAVDKGYDAAQKYLKAHLEPQRVLAMLKAAEAITSKGFPYAYGGGHGSFGIQPVDCSGLVSFILHAGGFIDSPMSVQQGSGLYTLGAPGAGKFFTWGVRGSSGENAHTMISVRKPTGTWGFFESGGTGGGAHEDSGWDGAFQFRHIPGFAKGGFATESGKGVVVPKDAPAKARKAIQSYGKEAFDPNSPHFVGWGFAKGGWTTVGATIDPEYGNPAFSNHGGMSFAELLQAGSNRSLKSSSLTATLGIGPPHYTAEGQDYGMAMGTPIHVRMPGSSKDLVMYKNDVGSGQAGDSHYKVDLHQRIADALGWSGNSDIEVSTKGGKEETTKEKDEHTYKEEVPAVYQGCRTDNLDFGSMPKSLKGVERELHERRAELPRYKAAAAAARKHERPAIAQALRQNITALEGQITKLEHERAKMRREVAQQKVTRRLAKSLAKITGVEALIEGAQSAYGTRNTLAQQIVEREPVEAEAAQFVPEARPSTKGMKKEDRERVIKEWERRNTEAENAYNQRRRGEEQNFERGLTAYIEKVETPAYASQDGVLGAEAYWRNMILQGENLVAGDWSKGKVGGMEGGFEDRLVKVRENIATISSLHDQHPDKWWHEHPKALKHLHELLSQLPMLRFKEGELSKSLTSARESFYPGGATVTDPAPPRPGTGSFEDSLAEVQGAYWPSFHERLARLPVTPQAGRFGGAIWDTQEVVEGLGLKTRELAAQIAEGVQVNELEEEEPEEAAAPDLTAWTAAKEAISLERLQNYTLGQGELGVFKEFLSELGPGIPYLGAFMTGTGGLRVGNTGLAMLHRDEMVVPDPKGPANSQFATTGSSGPAHHTVNLTFNGRSGELVDLVDARVDGKLAKVNHDLGRQARRRQVAPGRA